MNGDGTGRLASLLAGRGLTVLDEPMQLASGNWSRYFIDAKVALGAGADLRFAAEQTDKRVRAAGVEYDCVGGLTLGADALAAAIAVVAEVDWFIVRKQAKGRGTNRLVEGTRIGPGSRALLVDDVVTTGGSILRAYESVTETGATVNAAATLVDRGHDAERSFAELGVPYFAMTTYADIGIPALGTEQAATG